MSQFSQFSHLYQNLGRLIEKAAVSVNENFVWDNKAILAMEEQNMADMGVARKNEKQQTVNTNTSNMVGKSVARGGSMGQARARSAGAGRHLGLDFPVLKACPFNKTMVDM